MCNIEQKGSKRTNKAKQKQTHRFRPQMVITRGEAGWRKWEVGKQGQMYGKR